MSRTHGITERRVATEQALAQHESHCSGRLDLRRQRYRKSVLRRETNLTRGGLIAFGQ